MYASQVILAQSCVRPLRYDIIVAAEFTDCLVCVDQCTVLYVVHCIPC